MHSYVIQSNQSNHFQWPVSFSNRNKTKKNNNNNYLMILFLFSVDDIFFSITKTKNEKKNKTQIKKNSAYIDHQKKRIFFLLIFQCPIYDEWMIYMIGNDDDDEIIAMKITWIWWMYWFYLHLKCTRLYINIYRHRLTHGNDDKI